MIGLRAKIAVLPGRCQSTILDKVRQRAALHEGVNFGKNLVYYDKCHFIVRSLCQRDDFNFNEHVLWQARDLDR
jgi:adenylate kinase